MSKQKSRRQNRSRRDQEDLYQLLARITEYDDQFPGHHLAWSAFERALACSRAAGEQLACAHSREQEGYPDDDPILIGLRAQVETFNRMAANWGAQLQECLQNDHEPQYVMRDPAELIVAGALSEDATASSDGKRRP